MKAKKGLGGREEMTELPCGGCCSLPSVLKPDLPLTWRFLSPPWIHLALLRRRE